MILFLLIVVLPIVCVIAYKRGQRSTEQKFVRDSLEIGAGLRDIGQSRSYFK